MQNVRGTRDLIGPEKELFRTIESMAHATARLYGYEEIETPIFEYSPVFHRSLGESSDVIHKETYTFLDRGGDSLTLRPEGTASIARAFISEGMAQNLPLKFYYSGPMFRYERPQKGRYRQFYQIGVECLGYETPLMDIECISLGFDLLKKLNLHNKSQLEINSLGTPESRQNYRQVMVDYFSKYKNELSQDSQMRLEKNPLRILDSKDPKDKEISKDAPKLKDSYDKDSQKFLDDVLEGLTLLNIPYILNTSLVRGLDYYTHTVFEFTTQLLGAQGAILSGGRYDGLIELMGGPKTPGVGWAAGIDRLVELSKEQLQHQTEKPLIAIIGADSSGEKEALKVAQELRSQDQRVEVLYSGNMGKKMKRANKLNASYALILGEQEITQSLITVKNLGTGEQKTLSRKNLSDIIPIPVIK